MKRRIADIVEQARDDDTMKHLRRQEDAFLNSFALPIVFEAMQSVEGINVDKARESLLTESYRHLPCSNNTPARKTRHPFNKVIGANTGDIMRQWRGVAGGATLKQSCPDFAFQPPFPYKIVFEGKYFCRGGTKRAETELVTDIYQAFFYRALPFVEGDNRRPAWDYDYTCLLALDVTSEGTLLAAWRSLGIDVKRGFWEGANLYVMILRGTGTGASCGQAAVPVTVKEKDAPNPTQGSVHRDRPERAAGGKCGGLEDPEKLLKMKLGREEYCQRMLTSLIVGGPYPKWGSENSPSERGEAFLQELHQMAYGTPLEAPVSFIDEFDLPSDDGQQSGGCPDYAVFTPKHLWIIELKTESGSHRPDQLPIYARLAAHHYPDLTIEITYITGGIKRESEVAGSGVPFRHFFWQEIVGSVQNRWMDSPEKAEGILATAISREVANLHVPAKQFRDQAQVIREALRNAKLVQESGKQAGVEATPGGLEELHELRIRIRDAFSRNAGYENVEPWVWNVSSSGGTALTEAGRDVGYEIRLSRHKKPLYKR
jgi:hypothetical protein